MSDASEDYTGPEGGSYFVLSKEKDEQGRPMGFLTKKQAREARLAEEDAKWQREASSKQILDDFAAKMASEDTPGPAEE